MIGPITSFTSGVDGARQRTTSHAARLLRGPRRFKSIRGGYASHVILHFSIPLLTILKGFEPHYLTMVGQGEIQPDWHSTFEPIAFK